MFYLRPDDIRKDTEVPKWPSLFGELARHARDYRLERFYRAGAVNADTPLSEVPFVAMDFETTGLNLKKDAIVSIGLVPFDLQRIRCRESRHWILNPHKPMAEESVVIHGITHSEVKSAPDLLLVLDDLLAALAGRVVVVHHRTIERGFLDRALKARLNEGIVFPVVDTMELEARLHRHKPLGLWARLRGRKPVSIRLADSRSRYHLPFYHPHHAQTDALATAELLQAQIAHHFSPDTPIGDLWV
ncbi:3'-5' exonuclease [Oceanisphaera psychrotolerans]|uniref:DNA polymerase III subunit epsilon n=1 Tax=Oceanisphaera psychrotolerans TaxID=1414654 RepID=A0A1J4QB88_9GAMM|nr:3'-5' exonuclease [Oceanisphaera psychrotolerans]OIN07657.1 DNA polymerase III subunit epsilon [Oceanisphaera psychrotolerans]